MRFSASRIDHCNKTFYFIVREFNLIMNSDKTMQRKWNGYRLLWSINNILTKIIRCFPKCFGDLNISTFFSDEGKGKLDSWS